MRTPQMISVVVPNYNSGAALEAQLRALASQDYGGNFEVIVADNGSRDGSARRALTAVRGVLQARTVDASARRGPGAARNAGARAAVGDFLAFCDADDVVSSSWLRDLVSSAGALDLVGGRFDGDRLNSPAVRRCFALADPGAPHLGFLPAAAGSNLGVWTDVFAALGGFDERSRAGEDVALAWKAQLSGYRYATSDALVHKRFPTTLRDAARRFFGYGLGDVWLYSQFGAAGMPRRSRRGTFNVWMALVRGVSGVPRGQRRRVWVAISALSCGRLVGSARWRVVFT